MSDSNELTPREMEVLALAWQCMESDPKVDYAKLAQLTGYTQGSASVTFGKIKRKLRAKAAGSSAVPATPKKAAVGKSKTPKSDKRGAAEDSTAGTPSKKSKKASTPADDNDDEEFGNFTIKKEEVADISSGADAFFKDATAYGAFGEDCI